ncbi:MAG: hypothetical protein ABIG11_09975 [bacterium]
MNESHSFSETIKSSAAKILEVLPADGEITSWDLKIRLHLSGSVLYMALGWLASQGRVCLIPDELTYKVRIVPGQHAEQTQASSN